MVISTFLTVFYWPPGFFTLSWRVMIKFQVSHFSEQRVMTHAPGWRFRPQSKSQIPSDQFSRSDFSSALSVLLSLGNDSVIAVDSVSDCCHLASPHFSISWYKYRWSSINQGAFIKKKKRSWESWSFFSCAELKNIFFCMSGFHSFFIAKLFLFCPVDADSALSTLSLGLFFSEK